MNLSFSRREPRALLVPAAIAVVTAVLGASPAAAQAPAPAPTASVCAQVIPVAAPCTLVGKAAEAAATACRRAGVADEECTFPLARRVTQAARDAYLRSDTHRTARFQHALGDALPLAQAQWLGTHNSFNNLGAGFTLSHADSNQQLSLSEQLDVDVRSLELDLHHLPRSDAPGGREVVVCHGQGPDALHAGCTAEPAFSAVLPEVARWLRATANRDQVILLYLEDALKDPAAYTSAVATLDTHLRRADGSSMIHRPDPAARRANGCTPLPLDLTRAAVRRGGAQVVLVGSCAPGWADFVHDWNGVHVEGGRTSAYRPFPACDATYDRSVYATRLVRYFEDSTFVATVVDPATPPVDPEALSPEKVAAMTDCGVGLLGLDQLLPDDGRIAASIWSWADAQPRAADGGCALQRADGRWIAAPCAARRRAACVSAKGTWSLTARAVPFDGARTACRTNGGVFTLPRSGLQNRQLRQAAGPDAAVWVAHRVTARPAPAVRATCRKVAGRAQVRCAVRGGTGTRVRARLARGSTTIARATTVLRNRRGTVVLRPRALRRGRYRILLQVGDRRLTRQLALIPPR